MRRRGPDAPMPSCHYMRDRPCARPRECPVHGIVLRRPTRKRHLLRAAYETARWSPDGPFRPRTCCGLFLHLKTDLQAEIAKLVANRPDVSPLAALFEVQQRPGYWTSPIPSNDPNYEVFYQVGWESSREVLVVPESPTCGPCQKVEQRLRREAL